MDTESLSKSKKKKKELLSESDASFIDYSATQPLGEPAAEQILEPEKEAPGEGDMVQNDQKPTLLYRLFSPETRLGRFMRPAVRKTASYVAAFAIGLFCTYFLLFLPMAKELQKIKTEYAVTAQELQANQEQLASLQQRYDQTAADLEKADRRANYMQLLSSVSRARLALAEKDGPSAVVVLKDVEANLKTLSPAIVEVDANMAQLLNKRLELVMTELNRDPVTAVSDLEKLYSSLLELEKSLLK